jgi:hypothetical protein
LLDVSGKGIRNTSPAEQAGGTTFLSWAELPSLSNTISNTLLPRPDYSIPFEIADQLQMISLKSRKYAFNKAGHSEFEDNKGWGGGI